MVEEYTDVRFRQVMDEAMVQVNKLLDTTRNPDYPSEVPHKYQDKYLLAEFVIKTGCASTLQAWERLGLTPDALKTLTDYAKTRAVTLRLKAEERCTFSKTVKRDVDSATSRVTEARGVLGNLVALASKVVTTVTEHLWDFEYAYEIIAFRGSSPEEGAVVLQSGGGATVIVTAEKTSPRPAVVAKPAIDCDVTWMLQHVNAERQVDFSIDRRDPKKCHTPRRNPDTNSALAFFDSFATWSGHVQAYFVDAIFPIQLNHGCDVGALHANAVFIPILPLFEKKETEDEGEDARLLLSSEDTAAFLGEQARSLDEKLAEVHAAFPSGGALVTAPEAVAAVVCAHGVRLAQAVFDGVDYVEDLLRKGLIAAIGKVVSPDEFTAYMRFHNRRLFKDIYEPLPFCHSIRRPAHYPEGVVSIETSLGGNAKEPVPTMVRRISDGPAMSFPLNAATRVTFNGDRYLHAMVMHQFSGTPPAHMELCARARQFSSFIMLVGTIPSATVFEPTAAVVVRDKDDLQIPLLLETIPTPKEFKDAVEALSPEQRRFCEAYRSMQLSSTLFGVLVLQIKPQLEKLLCLVGDSLTKEIALTQNLLNLFMEYQIPSDQLKFDEQLLGVDVPKEARVDVVRGQVDAMNALLKKLKDAQLEEAQNKSRMAELLSEERPQRRPVSDGMALNKMRKMKQKGKRMMAPTMALEKAAYSAPFQSSGPAGAPAPSPSLAPAPDAAPSPAVPEEAAPPPQDDTQPSLENAVGGGGGSGFDVTSLPGRLDADYEKYDEDSSVHATVIKLGPTWSKSHCKSLCSPATHAQLTADAQKQEKKTAFDLIDALSRSGTLSFDHAELHVVVAATHCFDKSLLETVVQDNVNPIEKVERSVLIAASVVHGVPHASLTAKPLAFQPTLMVDQ